VVGGGKRVEEGGEIGPKELKWGGGNNVKKIIGVLRRECMAVEKQEGGRRGESRDRDGMG